YSSGEALQYLSQQNIDAWIPNFGQYKPEREGFIYNKQLNQYECKKDGGLQAILLFKGTKTDSKGYSKHIYRSSEKDCRHCPLRKQCCGNVTKFKKLDDSIHKPLYDNMHQKLSQNKAYHRRLIKRRSATVELILVTRIKHYNMRRINARGMQAANKHVLMAALSYNLKKYLKFTRQLPKIIAKSMSISQRILFSENLALTQHIFYRNERVNFFIKFSNCIKYKPSSEA